MSESVCVRGCNETERGCVCVSVCVRKGCVCECEFV